MVSAVECDISENVKYATELFEEYGGFIRSIIRFNIRDYEVSDDIFQDLFIHFVFRPVPSNIRCMESFLYKVITDKIKDSFRRINSYNTKIKKYTEYAKNVYFDNQSDFIPEKIISDVEETDKMFSMIEKTLPQNEAKAVIYRFCNNDDTTTIARRMGIKTRSVSRYVSIGLKKLRGFLSYSGKDSNVIH